MSFAPVAKEHPTREFTLIFGESADLVKSFADTHGWGGEMLSLDEAFPAFLRQPTCDAKIGCPIPAREMLQSEMEHLGPESLVFIKLTEGEVAVIRELMRGVVGRNERLALFVNYLVDSRFTTLMVSLLARRLAIVLSDGQFHIQVDRQRVAL